MNEDPNSQDKPNQPQVISPQWQYTSGQLSQQQQPVQQNPVPNTAPTNTAPVMPPAQQPIQPNPPVQPTQPLTEPQSAINPTLGQQQQTTEPVPINPAQIEPQNISQENSLYAWQASEFAANEKNTSWYLILAVTAVILSAITFLITKEYLSIIVIVVLAIAVGFYGNIKPRTLSYSIEELGIKIGEKFYSFNEFKSFSVLEDMAVPSINLMPIKKLMMPISIYVAPNDLSKVADILGNYLPFEEKQRDFADKLSHRLRF
ncbi:hypothetical protein KA043_01680 [Candidatus Saccharibacteria bacterium]|nr:hypothetical protein [Candidatus Saccharibacteria bacterium]